MKRSWRSARASWRDTLILLREFRDALVLLALTIVVSGGLFWLLAGQAGEPTGGLAEAMYITLALAFFQPTIAFPQAWYLQAFFFVMPVIGIGILAQGLTEFGVMLFNRRARGKEWEMAVASTFSDHVVLVGLGHLGYRVVKTLADLKQDVVVVSLNPNPDLVLDAREMGIPVIIDDAVRESVLAAAGTSRARAIILCTQDDSVNLRVALKARSLNPAIEVVIRIFDDDFAESLQKQFGFRAMSATGMAAPLFAATAAHVDITPPITIEGQPHILAHLEVQNGSRLNGLTVNAIEEGYRISVVLLCKNGTRQFHPAGQEQILSGSTVAVFGDPQQVSRLLHENHS